MLRIERKGPHSFAILNYEDEEIGLIDASPPLGSFVLTLEDGHFLTMQDLRDVLEFTDNRNLDGTYKQLRDLSTIEEAPRR